MGSHPDAFIFRSLPGAGAVYSGRLLAAMGNERDRFAAANEVACCSGVAPILKQSGNRLVVQKRYACSKFVCQSFIEYADQSIRCCEWAKTYYRQQRLKGKSHYTALRALAYKWIRILFRCWQERVVYDDAHYLQTLERRGSTLSVHIAEAALRKMEKANA